MTWNMPAMAGGAMAMMNMKITAPKVEKILEEAGPRMLGHATPALQVQDLLHHGDVHDGHEEFHFRLPRGRNLGGRRT